MAQIPIQYSARFREDITCRVWVKEALFALDDEGYIKLTKSVDAIDNEARSEAIKNKYLNHSNQLSRGWKLCVKHPSLEQIAYLLESLPNIAERYRYLHP